MLRTYVIAALLAPSVIATSLMTPSTVSAAAPTADRGTWPMDPRPEVVEGFAPPPSPWLPGHRGVDLLGAPGQVVSAALEGTVTFAGSIGEKPVVVVAHDGRRTTYEPVVAMVERGERVAEGTAIGRLQTVGSHCFPRACLHWGLREGDAYLDPLTLVGGGVVRLLPLGGLPVSALASWAHVFATWSPPLMLVDAPADRRDGDDRW